MTDDQAIKIAAYVLHHKEPGTRLKSKEILELAFSPEHRAMWVREGIDAPPAGSADLTNWAVRLTQALKRHVEGTRANRRVVNRYADNSWKLGPGAGATVAAVLPELRVTESRQLLGLAGEHAVMSELFACGWSSAKPPFDDGVDLVTTRNGEIRTVQVKTATLTSLGDGIMSFSGSWRANHDYSNVRHYYVLVMRTMAGSRWQNNFYVERAVLFDRSLQTHARTSENGEKWTLDVRRRNGRFLLGDSVDITDDLDKIQDRFH